MGWRWVYLINVPVGVIAVVSGYFLLPRTRDRSPATGLDWWGVGLLAVAATALLLGISTASGLALPAEITLGLLALSIWAGWAFVARQRCVAHPLIDMALLRNRTVSWGLLGATCGYLVLFGPLVLVPIVLTAQGRSAVAAGLALTALPAGFALAALVADRLLPHALSERQRATFGAGFCSAVLGIGLFVALTPATLVPLLALIGVGLGVFTPSNNTLIMASIPERAAATGGGLLNLSRGLGTALGVALVTLALHLGSGHPGILPGDRLAVLGLLLAAALATVASRIGPRARSALPGGGSVQGTNTSSSSSPPLPGPTASARPSPSAPSPGSGPPYAPPAYHPPTPSGACRNVPKHAHASSPKDRRPTATYRRVRGIPERLVTGVRVTVHVI